MGCLSSREISNDDNQAQRPYINSFQHQNEKLSGRKGRSIDERRRRRRRRNIGIAAATSAAAV